MRRLSRRLCIVEAGSVLVDRIAYPKQSRVGHACWRDGNARLEVVLKRIALAIEPGRDVVRIGQRRVQRIHSTIWQCVFVDVGDLFVDCGVRVYSI